VPGNYKTGWTGAKFKVDGIWYYHPKFYYLGSVELRQFVRPIIEIAPDAFDSCLSSDGIACTKYCGARMRCDVDIDEEYWLKTGTLLTTDGEWIGSF
jgi:hypothetical protein